MAQERTVVKQFDHDGDGRLNGAERTEARAFLKESGAARPGGPRGGGGPGGFGPRPFGGEDQEPASPGARLAPSEVKSYPKAPLYEPTVPRTFFLDFEDEDWEKQLAEFYNTDVELPATLTVDGVRYPGVGVHFRGASSFFMVGEGRKRSLNVSLDFTDSRQRLYGVRTLNLLNSHGDPSFLSSALYSHIARKFIPAPKVNLVKVAINGESWGIYVNVEQFNSDFIAENFKRSGGARWKVKGSPNGASGLDYVGDDLAEYKRRYQLKTPDRAQDWRSLVNLCRVLSTTPLDELEAELRPILDVDGVLWFLALDNVLVNSDGYWVRASDYSLYKDPAGVFHLIPHDMNESFAGAIGGPGGPRGRRGPSDAGGGQGGPVLPPPPSGAERDAAANPGAPPFPPQPGGFGGPGGPGPGGGGRNGFELDPLIGMDDAKKPLRSRLLAVPSLRAKYLDHVRTLAEDSLDWKNLGPLVAQYRELIEDDVRSDTRKLSSIAAFERATADAPAIEADPGAGGAEGMRRPPSSLRTFADRRRAFLLRYLNEGPGASARDAAAEPAKGVGTP